MNAIASAAKTLLKRVLMCIYGAGLISLDRCQRIYNRFDLKEF